MHHRLDNLYSCTCERCNHAPERFNLALNPKFKNLLKTVETAFKTLHKKGSYKPEDLDGVPEYKNLIAETNGILSRAFVDNDISATMLESLQNDVFLFSGLKTHAQLFEASRQLLTEDKKIKSFAQFSNDVSSIKSNYNQNYLEAEYDFARGSVLMAERWENFNNSDRYYLQYRTAADERVRASHQVLHDTTLPKTDPFWDRYFPPNGWRCRCTTVEVLASSNKVSDAAKAAKNGEVATTQIGKNGKNKLEIFRFNPGKQKVVFPPKHPYNKVAGAEKVKPIILTMIFDDSKEKRKAKDKVIKGWIQKNIPENGMVISVPNFKTNEATLLRKNIKGIADHLANPNLKDMATDIFSWIKQCKYTSSASLKDSNIEKSIKNIEAKQRRGVTGYNYYEFEWKKEMYRLNVEVIKGKEHPYSVNQIINAK